MTKFMKKLNRLSKVGLALLLSLSLLVSATMIDIGANPVGPELDEQVVSENYDYPATNDECCEYEAYCECDDEYDSDDECEECEEYCTCDEYCECEDYCTCDEGNKYGNPGYGVTETNRLAIVIHMNGGNLSDVDVAHLYDLGITGVVMDGYMFSAYVPEDIYFGVLGLPTPTREDGYVFAGWNTAYDGSGDTITIVSLISYDLTVFAQWKMSGTMVVVTFNPGDGDLLELEVEYGTAFGENMPSDPVHDFLRFDSWNTAPDGSGYNFDEATIVTEPVTLYAQWFMGFVPFSNVTVTFLGNGGVVVSDQASATVAQGNALGGQFPTVQPTRDGFVFRHWNTAQTLTQASPGTHFNNATPVNSDMDVYAQWGRQVTFNNNIPGGTSNITPLVIPEGFSRANMPITPGAPATPAWPSAPSRPGWEFVGWFTHWDVAQGVEYDVDTVINQPRSLYARWLLLTPYIVTFNTEGGTLDPSPVGSLVRFVAPGTTIWGTDNDMSLRHNRPPGHPSAPVPAEINRPAGTPAVTRTNPNTANSVLGNPLNTMTLADWRRIDNAADPLHQNPRFELNTTQASSGVVTSDLNVHARWVHRVTFNANVPTGVSVTINPSAIDIPIDTSATISGGTIGSHGIQGITSAGVQPASPAAATTLPNPNRPGFTFVGWYNMPIAVDTADASLPTGAHRLTTTCLINASGTVWARWNSNANVTVTFDIGAGTWFATTPVETGIRTLPQNATIASALGDNHVNGMPIPPIQDGYVFMGWYPQGEVGTGTRFTNTTQVADSRTVVARWLPAFDLITNPNGGGIRRPAPPFSTSTASGQTTPQVRPVAAGHTITQMSATNIWGTGVHSLGQGWAWTYSWTNAFGGTNAASRTNHTFHGWNTHYRGDSDLGTLFNQSTVVNGHTTIYAMWAPTITFNNNHTHSTVGGTFNSTITRNVLYGRSIANHHLHVNTAAGALTMPTVANWAQLHVPNRALIGWNTCPDGNGDWFDANTVIDYDAATGAGTGAPFTVYAIWSSGVAFRPGAAPMESIQEADRQRAINFSAAFPLNTLGGTGGMPDEPIWPNHEFRGWNTSPAGALTWVGPNTPIPAPWTLYAMWAAEVTFDAGAGTLDGQAVHTRNIDETIGAASLPSATRTGFTFAGWRDSYDQPFTATTPVPHSMTLVPAWTANTIQVTFNANHGATPATSTQPVTFDGTYATAMAHTAVVALEDRSGWTFGGWFDSQTNANGTTQVGRVLDTATVTNASNHTLFARWTENTVQATFNANHGATPATATRPVTIGGTYAAAMSHADVVALESRTGWTFAGWFDSQTNANGTTQTGRVLDTATVTNTLDHTLFARWTANTIQVTFNANHGTTPATSTQPVTFAGTYAAAMGHADVVALESRTGWTFGGWFDTQANANGTTQTGRVLDTATVTNASAHTLFARWTANTIQVTFNANHGTTPATSTQPVTFAGTYAAAMGHADVVALESRTGWTFAGWWTTPVTGGSEVLATTNVTNASNHTLYARWTANTYQVTFNANHGTTPATSTQPVTFAGTYAAAMGHADVVALESRTGWTFEGWWTTPVTGGVEVLATTNVTNASNHALYARWTVNTYQVTLDPTGGTLASGVTSPFTVTFGQAYGVNLTPIPTRTGFTFDGWFTAASGGTLVTAATLVTNANDHTLFAQWTAITVQVTLNPTGGILAPGATNLFTVTFDQPYGANLNQIPTRIGYTFDGWFTVGNGGTLVTAPILVSNASDHMLFAQWTLTQDPSDPGDEPSTTQPSTTQPPTTQPLTTEPSTTDPDTTEPPATSTRDAHDAFLIGFGDGTIRPEAAITRAQVATIFFRIMSDEDRARYWSQDNPFSDVDRNQWYNNAISTVANAGIFLGTPDGTFEPDRTITRAEFTAAAVRFMGVTTDNGVLIFNDIYGHWAQNYINAAAQRGWAIGHEGLGGRFTPNQSITRAEVAAVVNRMLGRLPESIDDLLPEMVRFTDNMDQNAWYFLYIQEATNSHYYVRKADGVHETWTQIVPPRNWRVLELIDSQPWHIFQ